MKKIVITLIVLVVVGTIGYKGKALLDERKKEVESAKLPTPQYLKVKLLQAKSGEISLKQSFLANVEAQRSVKISTKLAGYIKKIFVQDAQEVKINDILVKIDEKELLSNLNALKSVLQTEKSDLNIAKKIYNRNINLYKAGALPKEKLELSLLNVKAKESNTKNTEAKIAQIQNQLRYLNIKAPFSGVIDNVLLHKGDLAAAGRAILILTSNDKKLLITFSKEKQIKKGNSVFLKNKKIGEIRTIYKVAKNGLNVAEIKLNNKLNNPVGSQVEIEVLLGSAKGCIIPHNAILHTKEGYFIYPYKDKSFKKLKIEPILENDRSVVIKSCPKEPIAVANETTLSSLIAYKNVEIIGENNAQK